MGDIRAPVRTEDAAAPGEAPHRSRETDGAQEGSTSSPHVRLVVGGAGVEWDQVLTLLARETHTPMGREAARRVRPSPQIDTVAQSLRDTGQGRAALAV